MRTGGISNKNIINIIKANLECAKSWKDNNLSIFPIFICLKIINKIKDVVVAFINKWGGEEEHLALRKFSTSLNNKIFFIRPTYSPLSTKSYLYLKKII